MYDMWDVFQQSQINSAAEAAEAARRDSKHTDERLHNEVQRLESKIDGLALICQALFEILRDKGGISQSEVEAKVKEIDLRDGRQDGRILGKSTACPQCKRPAHTRQRTCMYCSTALSSGMLIEKPFGSR